MLSEEVKPMYPNSTRWVIKTLHRTYGQELSPQEYEEQSWSNDLAIASHLVWMCRKIRKMSDADKAGRWIGWVFGCMQFRLKLMSNSTARDQARADSDLIKAGRSRPAPQ
jgi:hypothetical protein